MGPPLGQARRLMSGIESYTPIRGHIGGPREPLAISIQ
jgi:hypothetical protein